MKQLQPFGFVPPHELSGMPPETPILVAFSGGADSSALLAMLMEYARRYGTPLSVAHVDHKLRGEASNRDRLFCRDVAQKNELPFYVLEADVGALAAEHHRGVEEEARHVRYEFFSNLMKQHQIPLLATAHNADDNAETMLFNLARGCSLKGLCGIPESRPMENGRLIRPLLNMAKVDIVAFCKEHQIPYVTDDTNQDISYSRNRIRHKVIPQLTEINEAAASNMARTGSWLRRDESLLSDMAADAVATHVKDGHISLKALGELHPAIASRVIATMLADASSDVRAVYIEDVLALANKAVPHAQLDLGNGAHARIEDDSLIITTEKPISATYHYFYPITPGETLIPEADALILVEYGEISHKSHKTFKNIYKKATTTRISFDKIYDGLFVKPRAEGDVILSGNIHKKIKKLMNEHRLPPALRSRLPLLCDKDGILWVPTIALRDGAADREPLALITLFYND